MNGIMFSLVAVPEEIAEGKMVCRAYVKTNGTVDKEALAKTLAEKTGQELSLDSDGSTSSAPADPA